MRAHLDVPTAGTAVDGADFLVRGWLWLGADHANIVKVEAWIGETLAGSTDELEPRYDVNAALALPPDVLTGFRFKAWAPLMAKRGLARVQIFARLADGSKTPVFETAFTPYSKALGPLDALRVALPAKALGLEIGAHSLPVPDLTPFYTDSVATYAGVAGYADFLADGRWLPIPTDALDYLCSSHVLEHLANPIASLFEWHRVLRPGGWLYLVVPDKRFTFDLNRPVTSSTHLLRDFFRETRAADSVSHIDEFVYQTDWARLRPNCDPADKGRQQSESRDYYRNQVARGEPLDIHYHTFTPDSLRSVLHAAGLVGGPSPAFELVAEAENFPPNRGDGIGLLLRKKQAGPAAAAPSTFTIAHADPGIPALPLVCPLSLEPLRCETTSAGTRELVAISSGQRYGFEGGKPVLLPASPGQPVRKWRSWSHRFRRYVGGRFRLFAQDKPN